MARHRPGGRRRGARPAVALAALALVASACGGSDARGDGVATLGGGARDGGARSSDGDAREAFVRYAECMRDRGVDMPDPRAGEGGMTIVGGRPGEAPDDDFEDADEECRHLLPDRGEGPQLSPEQQDALEEAELAYADCMREQGVDYPDPDFGDGGAVVRIGEGGVDPTDPEFQAADEECAHHRDAVLDRLPARDAEEVSP